MNSLISVIVPVYKVKEFLPLCVDSILAQTYGNFELFLVDDGSPDDCGEICDCYAEKDSRITVIHKDNGGLSDARNAAIDRMKGDYVTFIDSDDYISADYLKKMIHCAKKYDADIVQCNHTRESSAMGQKTDASDKDITLIYDEDILRDYLHYGVPQVYAWGKLYRASLFEGIRYPFGLIDEDNFTTYKLMYLSKVFVNVNYNMYFYRVNPNSIMHMAFDERKFGILKSVDEIRAFLADRTDIYDDDVTYYQMRQYIQIYNNAIQADALQHYFSEFRAIRDTLIHNIKGKIPMEMKYRVLLSVLERDENFYRLLIQKLRA